MTPLRMSVLALLLGAAAALLVACGSSGGLIPTADAGPLQHDFDQVQAAAQGHDCTGVHHWLDRAEKDFAALPPSVDSGLHGRLQQGIQQLTSLAYAECQGSTASSTTPASTTPASTTPPATSTQTPTTQSTSTTPPPTTTAPSTTTTETNTSGGTGAGTPTTSTTTGATVPIPPPSQNGGVGAPPSGGDQGAGGGTP